MDTPGANWVTNTDPNEVLIKSRPNDWLQARGERKRKKETKRGEEGEREGRRRETWGKNEYHARLLDESQFFSTLPFLPPVSSYHQHEESTQVHH